jgi:hypothetical protein
MFKALSLCSVSIKYAFGLDIHMELQVVCDKTGTWFIFNKSHICFLTYILFFYETRTYPLQHREN